MGCVPQNRPGARGEETEGKALPEGRSHCQCRTLSGGLSHTESTSRPEESAQQEAVDGYCSWPSAPTPTGFT